MDAQKQHAASKVQSCTDTSAQDDPLEAAAPEELVACSNFLISNTMSSRLTSLCNRWKDYSTVQHNFIAKCQYNCTGNVFWCQLHSSHIHVNHKTNNNTCNTIAKNRTVFQYFSSWCWNNTYCNYQHQHPHPPQKKHQPTLTCLLWKDVHSWRFCCCCFLGGGFPPSTCTNSDTCTSQNLHKKQLVPTEKGREIKVFHRPVSCLGHVRVSQRMSSKPLTGL